jgi:hypothetical protein
MPAILAHYANIKLFHVLFFMAIFVDNLQVQAVPRDGYNVGDPVFFQPGVLILFNAPD